MDVNTRLFVGNLPPTVREWHLREVFGVYGTITHILLRGVFGFIEFSSPDEMLRAYRSEADMLMFDGVTAKVEPCKDSRRGSVHSRKRSLSNESDHDANDVQSLEYKRKEFKSSVSGSKDILLISTDDAEPEYVDFVQSVKLELQDANYWYVNYEFHNWKPAVYDFVSQCVAKDAYWAVIYVRTCQARHGKIARIDSYLNNVVDGSWKAVPLTEGLQAIRGIRNKRAKVASASLISSSSAAVSTSSESSLKTCAHDVPNRQVLEASVQATQEYAEASTQTEVAPSQPPSLMNAADP